jgi:hypothetical protein
LPAYEVIEMKRPDEDGTSTFRIAATPTTQDDQPGEFPEGCVFCGENGLLPFRPEVKAGGYVIPASRTVNVTPRGRKESEPRLLPIPFSYLLVPHGHPELFSILHGALNNPPLNPFRSGLPDDWQRRQEQLLRRVPDLDPAYTYKVTYEPIPTYRRAQGWEEGAGASKWMPHPYVTLSFGTPGNLEDQLLWQIWEECRDLPDAFGNYQRRVTRANVLRAEARRDWVTSGVSHRKASR